MNVDLLLAIAVEVAEFVGKELASSVEVVIRSLVVREVILNRAYFELLFEEVDFVEEKDDGGSLEPRGVDDGFKKHNSFLHLVLGYIRISPIVGPAVQVLYKLTAALSSTKH